MIESERAEFRKKLDDLSKRIRARTEEFRQTGEFSDTHEALLKEIKQRNNALSGNVAEAERKGTTWALVKAEFARDYSSLYDDLLQFEERLDAEAMRDRNK